MERLSIILLVSNASDNHSATKRSTLQLDADWLDCWPLAVAAAAVRRWVELVFQYSVGGVTDGPDNRSTQVWHVFSNVFTVLPAHPHDHPQSKWTIPAFAFPAAAVTYPKVWSGGDTNIDAPPQSLCLLCALWYCGIILAFSSKSDNAAVTEVKLVYTVKLGWSQVLDILRHSVWARKLCDRPTLLGRAVQMFVLHWPIEDRPAVLWHCRLDDSLVHECA